MNKSRFETLVQRGVEQSSCPCERVLYVSTYTKDLSDSHDSTLALGSTFPIRFKPSLIHLARWRERVPEISPLHYFAVRFNNCPQSTVSCRGAVMPHLSVQIAWAHRRHSSGRASRGARSCNTWAVFVARSCFLQRLTLRT